MSKWPISFFSLHKVLSCSLPSLPFSRKEESAGACALRDLSFICFVVLGVSGQRQPVKGEKGECRENRATYILPKGIVDVRDSFYGEVFLARRIDTAVHIPTDYSVESSKNTYFSLVKILPTAFYKENKLCAKSHMESVFFALMGLVIRRWDTEQLGVGRMKSFKGNV